MRDEDNKIIKSKEQIIKLKFAMQEELNRLPEYSIFGESNDESKAELRQWIKELELAITGKLTENKDSEIYYYLIGENESLEKLYNTE